MRPTPPSPVGGKVTTGGKAPAARGARLAFHATLLALALLTGLSLVLVISALTQSRPQQARAGSGTQQNVAPSPASRTAAYGIAPDPGWRSLAPATRLTRIGFGSCLDQLKPQPIWSAVVAARPQLFVMLGDNVYSDIRSPDVRELREAYRLQSVQPELAVARAAMPFLATWDDHDYGANDLGAGFAQAPIAADMFREFWQAPDARQPDGGIYRARTFGPKGARVQIILLDTRTFRSRLKPRDAAFPHWGRYMPDPDPSKTMLGDGQWRWLEHQLTQPAEIRLIASSIQVIAEGHGFERWGNLPAERSRLFATIARTGAKGVIFLSGDRHVGAIYRQPAGGHDLVEVTSSSLNRAYGPSKDTRLPPLVSTIYHPENFATLDIDWAARRLSISLRGIDGRPVIEQALEFAALGIAGK